MAGVSYSVKAADTIKYILILTACAFLFIHVLTCCVSVGPPMPPRPRNNSRGSDDDRRTPEQQNYKQFYGKL